MKVLSDLVSSEKFIASIGAIGIATVGAFQGALSWTDYYKFVQVIMGLYIGGKTIQGTAAAISSRSTMKDIEMIDEIAEEINERVDKLIEEKFIKLSEEENISDDTRSKR